MPNRSADDSAKRVPGAIIEPVEKVVEAIFGQMMRRPVVEPGVELVNDRFETDDRKQSRRKPNQPCYAGKSIMIRILIPFFVNDVCSVSGH